MSSSVADNATVAKMMRRVNVALLRYSYRFADEIALQDRIADVLAGESIEFVREHIASERDRFDFLLPEHGLVIEVKVDGSFADAIRQVDRYCARADVRACVLAATTSWARSSQAESQYHGKPVSLIHLRRTVF